MNCKEGKGHMTTSIKGTRPFIRRAVKLTSSDHELNRLIREHDATAVIHTGDFGFLTEDSLERMGDK